MRKIWILAVAVVLANAAIDEVGLNACINKGDAASCEKTLAALEKKLLERRRSGVLLYRGVLRQRANGPQGRGEGICDLQRRLHRRERGELLRGVGVLSKGRRRSAEL